MITAWTSIAIFGLFGGLLSTTAAAANQNTSPNVILILMDDMGWRDVGFMGNSFVETPHLDQLAHSSVVFNQAYAAAPNCAPTRACLMSGQYTPRHGIYTVVDPRQPPGSPWHKLQAAESKSDLDTNIITIAESLQSNGYATAFLGMWNLGRGRSGPVTPAGQGFERVVFPENLGFAKDAYFDKQGNYLSDRLTDELLAFVEQNKAKPFFAYYADHAVHAPFNPKPDLKLKYEQKMRTHSDRRNDPAYAATIEAVDQNVGRILNRLKALGLSEDTIVIFTSDNGGTNQYTPPLNGGKGELYEGGLRVPLLISWKGLKHGVQQTEIPVSTVDLYPTILELTKTSPPKQILDGVSLVPCLLGAKELPRQRLFWHFPCYVGKATPSSALREGDFKLIEFFEDGGRRELYDLRHDPGEQKNLAAIMPEKADAMLQVLKAWQRQTSALLPSGPNPSMIRKRDAPEGICAESKYLFDGNRLEFEFKLKRRTVTLNCRYESKTSGKSAQAT